MKRRARIPSSLSPGLLAFRRRTMRAPLPTAAWLNEVQAELVRRIEERGIRPETIRAVRDAIVPPKAMPPASGGTAAEPEGGA
jgi:hypothetical protein